jgi:hypothetical protein
VEARLAADAAGKPCKIIRTTYASAAGFEADVAAKFATEATGKAEAGNKIPTVPVIVDNTDDSSNAGIFQTAVSSETMKGGDVALYQNDNVERNPTKRDSLVKDKKSGHCQESSRIHCETICKCQ